MGAAEQSLPGLDGALIPGPVFFAMTLLGDPAHKARHRSRIAYTKDRKPFIHNYPDPDTEAAEKVIKQAAALQMRGRQPSGEPLCVLVVVDVRVPKSWPQRDQAAALDGRIVPTSRPDWDNFGKLCSDALNEIVWRDDAQVVDARVVKRYSARPALTVEVREFISPL
jgi:Holliday junction resolvase RusA-like endonuclease